MSDKCVSVFAGNLRDEDDKLLEGCSYLESFKNEIVNETDDDKMYNSAVLFYNYNYGGKKGTEKAGFTYLGTYAYEE